MFPFSTIFLIKLLSGSIDLVTDEKYVYTTFNTAYFAQLMFITYFSY
jgi:hypothetical protein